MRMSEAMRLGSMLAAPIHGPVFSYDAEPCRACAIGAALLGVYSEQVAKEKVDCLDLGPLAACRELWPWTMRHDVADPVTGRHKQVLITVIHLFETQQWTREQIADWLETIEPVEVGEQGGEDGSVSVAGGAARVLSAHPTSALLAV